MKTLVLVRHAKSDWDNPDLQDIDRPLNLRGIKGSEVMAEAISKKGPKADLIISSPALRARTTANKFAEKQNYAFEEIKIESDIYFGSWRNVLLIIRDIEDKNQTVYLFGHNPTISNLCHNIAFNFNDMFPTCGVVCLDFEIDSWIDIESVRGKVRYFDCPKKHLS